MKARTAYNAALAYLFKVANELRDAGLPESAVNNRFVPWTEAQVLAVAHVRDAWARLAFARRNYESLAREVQSPTTR